MLKSIKQVKKMRAKSLKAFSSHLSGLIVMVGFKFPHLFQLELGGRIVARETY